MTANEGGGVRVRMGVGMICAAFGVLVSSKAALGEDMDRALGFLTGAGEGEGEEAGDVEGCRTRSSGG